MNYIKKKIKTKISLKWIKYCNDAWCDQHGSAFRISKIISKLYATTIPSDPPQQKKLKQRISH